MAKSYAALINLQSKFQCTSCNSPMTNPYTSILDECGHSICPKCYKKCHDIFYCVRCATKHDKNNDVQVDDYSASVIRQLREFEKLLPKPREDDFDDYRSRRRKSLLTDDDTHILSTVSGSTSPRKIVEKSKNAPKPNQLTVSADVHRECRTASKDNELILPRIAKKPDKSLEFRNKKGETELHVACNTGKAAKVESLLEDGADPNTVDNAGWSPLHDSAVKGFHSIAELLLKYGAYADIPGMQNDTALHIAVRNKDEKLASLLYLNGADIYAKNAQGETPLNLAAPSMRKLFETETLRSQEEVIQNMSAVQIEAEMENVRVTAIGLAAKQIDQLKDLCKKHKNVKVESRLSPKTTHVLVNVDASGKCQLSLGVLQAIIHRYWILTADWMDACTSDSLASVVDHEVNGVVGYEENGPRRSRESRFKKAPRLFNGCNIFFKGFPDGTHEVNSQLSLNKEMAMKMVMNAGGNVLKREPRLELITADKVQSPYYARLDGALARCSHYIVYSRYSEPAYNTTELKALPVAWFVDSICMYELKEP